MESYIGDKARRQCECSYCGTNFFGYGDDCGACPMDDAMVSQYIATFTERDGDATDDSE